VFLTITARGPSATDLSHLLHKHPDKVQQFDVAGGVAHVFHPERDDGRCTVALLVEVDPIALVRGRRGRDADGFSLAQYVDDRPYAASSLLAVALGRVFRTAMAGTCRARPELPGQRRRLELHVPALSCRGGSRLAERLFAPLGWQVTTAAVPLDPTIPAWGDSRYVDLRLNGCSTLADALTQLYVLLPVLDGSKHYWENRDEVDKLLRAGERWLPGHPDRELIVARYLRHHRSLGTAAVARLAEVDDAEPEAFDNAIDNAVDAEPAAQGLPFGDSPAGSSPVASTPVASAPAVPAPVACPAAGRPAAAPPSTGSSLADRRRAEVLAVLREVGATQVVDLGCGEGALLRDLLADPAFTRIVGTDVSPRALDLAARRLAPDRLPERTRERLHLMQSSLTYRDERLAGFDAAVLMEVLEHVDPQRLPAVARTVFGWARPNTVVVTTPNAEYNVHYKNLFPGALRHRDHRFEWTREEFSDWTQDTAARYGYTVRVLPVGDVDPQLGPSTQLALFTRAEATTAENNVPRRTEQ
jgi:SAM-dependent methyltransferase